MNTLLGITAYILIVLGILLIVAMLGGLSSPDFSTAYWRNYLGGSVASVTLLVIGAWTLSKLS